jgi:hypothetical protein
MSRFSTAKTDSVSIVERGKRNQVTLWFFTCNQLLLVNILVALTLVLGVSLPSLLSLTLITTLIRSNPLITLAPKLRRWVWRKRPPKPPRWWRHPSRHEAMGLRRKREWLLHLVKIKHRLLRRWLLLVCLPVPTPSPPPTSTSASFSHDRLLDETFLFNSQTAQP